MAASGRMKKKSTCVISGDSSDGLAENIAGRLHAKLVKAEMRVFADGESKIRLRDKITGQRAVIVQSLHPPVDTNLLRALCLISKAKEKMSDVTVVIPYMGYARQDAEFLSGEITTIKVLGDLLYGAGASRVIVVDIHSEKGLGLLGSKATNVSAIPALARHLDTMQLEDPIVISPDKGGAKRAEMFASEIKCDMVALEKSRDRNTGAVRIRTKKAVAVAGRDAIIVDDMISTGGSIVKAAEFLKSQDGSGRIFAACTHALLVDGARTKIKKAGVSKIIASNTIPNDMGSAVVVTVDVSDAIAQVLL